jgi:HK97 family phage portal protein
MIWPFNRRAPVETKSLAAPDAALLAVFGISGGPTAISGPAALKVPAVAAAVRCISEAAATLPISVKRTAEAGTDIDATDHPAHALLAGAANDWLDGWELVRDLVAQALVNDRGGLAYIGRNANGVPVEIIQPAVGQIDVQFDVVTREPSYRLAGRPIPATDIIHVRGPFDRCPVSLAAEAIGAAAAMEKHAAGLFARGARPGGILEIPGDLPEKGLISLLKSWHETHDGASKSGNTAVLLNGGKWNPGIINSTDAQFLENRKFQNIEIARAFRVPPSMLYEIDRATWSNSEQMGKEFLTYCLEPWLRAVESAFGRALLAGESGLRIVIDRDDLTRADLGARATAYSSLIASRVLNPNEARQWEGLQPYAGGETFINPAITNATPPSAAGVPNARQ